MDNKDLKENLKVAEEILKNVNIPGKKDSMLAAAKINHVEKLGVVLNDTLINTCLSQAEINEVVTEFKKKYSDTFLKFIQKEG